MPVERFGSHFSQNGLINLNSLQECHIFIALSVDTHTGYPKSYKVTWLYGFNAAIKPNYEDLIQGMIFVDLFPPSYSPYVLQFVIIYQSKMSKRHSS